MFNWEATPTTDTIMKSLKTMLPALGLVLGAGMAMAMNFPTMIADNTATKVWTPDPSQTETNGYRDITNEVINVDYECNSGAPECRVEFSNDDPYEDMTILTAGSYDPLVTL